MKKKSQKRPEKKPEKKTVRAKTGSPSSPPSKHKSGDDLFNQVISLTGIPGQAIKHELKGILDRKGIDVNDLTLDQLRCVVASYLREIMGGILDRYGKKSETPP